MTRLLLALRSSNLLLKKFCYHVNRIYIFSQPLISQRKNEIIERYVKSSYGSGIGREGLQTQIFGDKNLQKYYRHTMIE